MTFFAIILAVILGAFITGWFFMLGVGNLGLGLGYGDSVWTAGLLAAVFTGASARARIGD